MTQASTARSTGSIFTNSFSTFSITDVDAARKFYGQTLELDVRDEEEGLALKLPGGQNVFLYPKDDHAAASFTVLNFQVPNIAEAVKELSGRGIEFLTYDHPMKTDDVGIYWGAKTGKGPNIAWFRDPAKNIISVIEEK